MSLIPDISDASGSAEVRQLTATFPIPAIRSTLNAQKREKPAVFRSGHPYVDFEDLPAPQIISRTNRADVQQTAMQQSLFALQQAI